MQEDLGADHAVEYDGEVEGWILLKKRQDKESMSMASSVISSVSEQERQAEKEVRRMQVLHADLMQPDRVKKLLLLRKSSNSWSRTRNLLLDWLRRWSWPRKRSYKSRRM